ncbi:MAG TPA: crosslink repair DNA glycosylase YcaQ family protein [Aggregatilineaceae bacterium]|nr:crosslink repair DNA glycosylase YcaQ family protein [Aggregatilineaceae bacterium]
MSLSISSTTQRRFILGKQGLFPGRRWMGASGVLQAIQSGSIVQVDPLNVVARSHDIVLYGRVLDYTPAQLDTLLYTNRALFDWGGTVMIYPMDELPYRRVAMQRKITMSRWTTFASDYADVIDQVREAVTTQGPLSARDLSGVSTQKSSRFRSSKATSQALYYLWLGGELMTHSRRGFDRVYDLRERIAPPHLQHAAPEDEAEAYFEQRVFHHLNIVSARSWRGWFAGDIERTVDKAEAEDRLQNLLDTGTIVPITLAHDPKTPRYILADDLPLLEMIYENRLPEEWHPVETSTQAEMVFLAPLEIVSTRGRALPLFGFEYLWEVYKPESKRRWGYYTLPILYKDQLVARFDPKLDRASKTLLIKGFWLEDKTAVDAAFSAALDAGFERFMQFVGADTLEFSERVPDEIRELAAS